MPEQSIDRSSRNPDDHVADDDQAYRRYWEQNVTEWGKFYLETSHGHETFDLPAPLNWLYRRLIIPIEARLMRQRYERTMAFIEEYVCPGAVVSDIGCGTGIFATALLQRGCEVHAIDFSRASLKATKQSVEAVIATKAANATYHLLDAARDKLPESKISLAVGVTPYITDIDRFFDNVLSSTQLLFVLIVDSEHWINRLRRVLPFLNVRRLQFFSARQVDDAIARNGWRSLNRLRFATGFIDTIAAPTFTPKVD